MNYPRVGAVGLVHLSLIGLLLVGCGGPSGSYQGVVQFDDGSPVQSGSIELRSLADRSRYASRIATDGSFSLAGQNGELRCPPGDYEAVVVQIVLTEDLAAEAHQHGQTVPRRYADYYTSDLRVTNDSDPASPILITLKSSDQSSD